MTAATLEKPCRLEFEGSDGKRKPPLLYGTRSECERVQAMFAPLGARSFIIDSRDEQRVDDNLRGVDRSPTAAPAAGWGEE